MAFGNVYVFNLYVENMTQFSLNGMGSAGKIPAPVITTTPPYTPQQLVVARTNLTQDQLDSPLFVQGANSVLVNYGGDNWKGTVTIPLPPSPALAADLWLYVCYMKAFLFDTAGNMIPQGASLTSRGGGGDGSVIFEPVSEGDINIKLNF